MAVVVADEGVDGVLETGQAATAATTLALAFEYHDTLSIVRALSAANGSASCHSAGEVSHDSRASQNAIEAPTDCSSAEQRTVPHI